MGNADTANEQKNLGSDYATYQSMVSQVSASLLELEKVCRRLKLEENAKNLKKSREKLADHKFAVGIMGEFKRGKSTVINSLLEKEIMPADIMPSTATMNRVTYDLQPHAELQMMDGSVKSVPVDQLKNYVTKLTGESERMAANINEAVVYYPCKFCQNGVDIIDTPGLNDDERMNKICEEVIPKLDAVIMVITPDSPFSMSESEFVRSKLLASDLGRLIFVINKIDTIQDAEDRVRVVEGIKQKIQTSVLEKMADIYGKDSREYNDAKLKLGSIRVYPISARNALEGKQKGDHQMIDESGTIPFEEVLTRMLVEERGALELAGPLNAIQHTSIEVAKAAETQKRALELSSEEFTVRQQTALQEIKELRQKKKEERDRLTNRAVNIKAQLETKVAGFYSQLEKKLCEVVDDTAIDTKTLQNQAGQETAAEKLKKAVSDEMQSSMSLLSERIQISLEKMLGKEVVKLGTFMEEVAQRVDTLQVTISQGNKKAFEASDMLALGADTLLIGGWGIGGVVAGYKNAGVKGAIVGGGISHIATLSMAALLCSLSVAGLPLILISCVTGGAAGRYITGKLFGKENAQKQLNELRSAIKKEIHNMIYEMQCKRELENWGISLVDERFRELISGMEDECERLLNDTENTMDSIKESLTQNEMQRGQTEKVCDRAISYMKQLNEQLMPLSKKVYQTLEQA